VQANWRDNPWFTPELEQERIDCQRMQPEQYRHIWEGDYVTVAEGAYYAEGLALAEAQGRIGNVSRDPLMSLRAYCDIGGTGARADAFAMWIVQFVGREIRVLDYYEAVGQEFGEHVYWLRKNGYERAEIILPHDGVNHDKVYKVTPESYFKEADFNARSMAPIGAGADSIRIEAVRRILPSCWFNRSTTEAGRKALGWFHQKIDPKRKIGLGVEEDWSNHGADAFGQMAVDYEERAKPKQSKALKLDTKWVV
jgi:phage terminase large subunit